MYTIEYGNSMCKIIVNEERIKQGLFNLLSYPDKQKEFAYKRRTHRFKSFRVYLIKGDVEDSRTDVFLFPSGLLEVVQEYLGSQGIQSVIKECRRKPQETHHFRKYGKMPVLRDYQEAILEECMKHERGIIEAATGTGKSLTMVELIYRRELPTLLVVPSINILNQFHKVLIDVFSAKEVGIVGGGKDQNKKNIIISTYQSLLDKPKEWFDKFGQVIFDEAHHNAAGTIQEINEKCLNNIFYRYYFTATPFRNDGADKALAGVIGSKKLYVYNFKKACADGWLTPPTFIMCKYIHSLNTTYDDYSDEYKSLITNNEKYNDKVAQMTEKLKDKGRHILIFVKHIEQGERLQKKIKDSILLTGLESSEDSKKIIEGFENKQFSVLIGTSVIGEGVDLKSVDCGIMAGGGRSKGEVMQKVGRTLRLSKNKKDVIFIDFTHDGSKWLSRHSLERREIYKSYCTKIHDIE